MYCATNKYDQLYSRWLENPGKLLDFAEFTPSERLLDLCGGTGAVSKEALRRGAQNVTLVDLNPRCTDPRVSSFARDLTHEINFQNLGTFDICVIRQALGYLNLHPLVLGLAPMLPYKGAKVVFNTFVAPRWKTSLYRHQERLYGEMSGHYGAKVFHVQVCSEGFDFSIFKYHKHVDIVDAFTPWFNLTCLRTKGRSLYYLFERTAVPAR